MATAKLKPSKIVAIVLVGVVVLWIGSGVFGSNQEPATEAKSPTSAIPIQKVSVATVVPETHERSIFVSCVTEADRRATAAARGNGVIIELMAVPGAVMRAGQTAAIISDEGREASVKQAEALVAQRNAEYDASKKLIDQGTTPRNTLPALEAAVAAADASLSAALAEAEKLTIKSPIDGIIDSVPVQVGQAVRDGTEIAEVIDPDPMLAVGAVSEFRRASLKIGQSVTVRFVNGSPRKGTINHIGLSAEAATRTYKVEARMMNPDALIADGLTCEMNILLAPIEAVSIPRSALVFSDDGQLGVRVADVESKARFVPIEIVDDGRSSVWVSGIENSASVIVVGQDFVKDGDPVEAVPTAEAATKTEPPA